MSSLIKEKYQEKINTMSFEQALKELELIVNRLETGQDTLEKAIEDYEYGNALSEFCKKKLLEAKLKVDKVLQSSEGDITIESTMLNDSNII